MKRHSSLTVATVNVNGLRAATTNGMATWVAQRQPDVITMQEVRAPDELVAEIRAQQIPFFRSPERAMRAMAGRLDQSMPVGNEGAGTVIEAGDSPEAQALLGQVVAVMGGAMYSQYRVVKAQIGRAHV